MSLDWLGLGSALHCPLELGFGGGVFDGLGVVAGDFVDDEADELEVEASVQCG
jgi:hypothetical protein